MRTQLMIGIASSTTATLLVMLHDSKVVAQIRTAMNKNHEANATSGTAREVGRHLQLASVCCKNRERQPRRSPVDKHAERRGDVASLFENTYVFTTSHNHWTVASRPSFLLLRVRYCRRRRCRSPGHNVAICYPCTTHSAYMPRTLHGRIYNLLYNLLANVLPGW